MLYRAKPPKKRVAESKKESQMKPGEISITFTCIAADNAATEKLAREIISRMTSVDGVSFQSKTRYNTDGPFQSIDHISFSRGIDTTLKSEPQLPLAKKDSPILRDFYSKERPVHPYDSVMDVPRHPNGTIDLIAVGNKANRVYDHFIARMLDNPAEPLPKDATPAERASWMIARQLETAHAEFYKLHSSMSNGVGVLNDQEIARLQKLGDLLPMLRKAHIANMVQSGKSQKEVAETNDISYGRVSQIVKEVGIPERYLANIICDNVANLLLKVPEKSEVQHLVEMGFPLTTEEQLAGAVDEEVMTPAALLKAGIFPPSSFYNETLDRYVDVINGALDKFPEEGAQSAKHLLWMLYDLRANQEQSVTKKHRWLGYIQGVLCTLNILNVQNERDLTRKVFNGA